MASDRLIDYIRWRGDLSFETCPLSLADSVILCELSYIDFTQVLEPNSPAGITLREAFKRIEEEECFQLLTAAGGTDELARAAAMSERFGKLKLTHYTDVSDLSSIQFAAVHFELNNLTSYIAFRGTDNTIIGWKEDFMMSFQCVPAQESAAEYLSATMSKDRDYYVGGHSKGGNLAVYAASKLSVQERRHLLRIFVNDAPGFDPDVYDMKAILELKPLITKITPAYGMIGQMFRLDSDTSYIVKSSASGILQHDLETWLMDGPSLAFADAFEPGAVILQNSFNKWIENVDEDGRKVLVDLLFDSLSAIGAITVGDIGVKDMPEVLKAILSAGKEAKEIVMDLPKSYFAEAGKLIQEALNERLNTLAAQKEKKEQSEPDEGQNEL